MADDTRVRVMIVDDIVDTRDQIEKLLIFEKDIEVVGKASNGREAVAMARKLAEKSKLVILMDINMPEMDGIQATEAIMAQMNWVGVIIMSVQGETDYLRRAMGAGAREFLIKPIGADDLYKGIRDTWRKTPDPAQYAQQPGGVRGIDGPPAPVAMGKLLSVFSPKGGVGTSFVAANLAVALRQQTNKRVALVDGNLTFGALDVILNLTSGKSIMELSNRIHDMDRDLINDVLQNHPSGVKALLAPPDPQSGEAVGEEHWEKILEAVRREFDYVVVDTQSSFHSRSLKVFDLADTIITLLTLEMHCIKNIRFFLEVAEMLGYPKEKVMLVLNKADNRMGIKVTDVETTIKRKVAAQIGNAAQDVTLSINQGVPLLIEKPSHPASRDIMLLARQFIVPETAETKKEGPKPEPEKRSNSLFGRLMTRQ